MARVQALLARAASSEFEAEADASRKKAAEIMTAYQIEEYELVAKGDQRKPVPTVRTMDCSFYDQIREDDVKDAVWTIFNCTIRYTGGISAPYTDWHDGKRILQVVGLPVDLDYMEMLFTSLFMECMTRMTPKADPAKTMIQNLVALKEVGHKWEYIGNELIKIGQLTEYTRNVGVRFTKIYSDHCKQNGREQVRINPTLFKRSFIQGFSLGVMQKLQEMAKEKDQAFDMGGMGLVLRDNRVDVQEEWNKLFGHIRRDQLVHSGRRIHNFDHGAVQRGVQSGREAAVAGRPGEGIGNGPRRGIGA